MSSLTDGHATMLRSAVHRGGKLFISHGGSLWAGKLAVLLRLHHSRQPASCVLDLPCWVEGRCPFPGLAGLAKLNKIGCDMNKIGCSMNKIGWFMKSKHRAGYTRCVPEQNQVVRGDHFLGVIGAVLRGRTPKKRFGVLRAHKA